MSSSKLGFGMMRLPQRSPEATDIDFEQVSQMVDRFLAAGFTYFDTSWTYHNEASETAVKRCLVSRHPRDSFVLASKLPTFAITKEEEAEEIFNQQLERCDVDYFDYYLLHNVNWMRLRLYKCMYRSMICSDHGKISFPLLCLDDSNTPHDVSISLHQGEYFV